MSDALVDQFLAARAARGDAVPTLQARACWLNQLVAWRGPVAWAQLTRGHLERWHQHLLWHPGRRGRLYSPHTVDQALHSARLFLRWAAATGQLAADPMAGWLLKKPQVPPPALLSRTELQRLLAAPGEEPLGLRDRAALELLSLGLSTASCAELDLVDLDREAGHLRARLGRSRRETLVLTPASREHLERYVLRGRPRLNPRSDAFLVSDNGLRLTHAAVLERLKIHARAAGLRVTARQLVRSQAVLREQFRQRRLFPLAEDR